MILPLFDYDDDDDDDDAVVLDDDTNLFFHILFACLPNEDSQSSSQLLSLPIVLTNQSSYPHLTYR